MAGRVKEFRPPHGVDLSKPLAFRYIDTSKESKGASVKGLLGNYASKGTRVFPITPMHRFGNFLLELTEDSFPLVPVWPLKAWLTQEKDRLASSLQDPSVSEQSPKWKTDPHTFAWTPHTGEVVWHVLRKYFDPEGHVDRLEGLTPLQRNVYLLCAAHYAQNAGMQGLLYNTDAWKELLKTVVGVHPDKSLADIPVVSTVLSEESTLNHIREALDAVGLFSERYTKTRHSNIGARFFVLDIGGGESGQILEKFTHEGVHEHFPEYSRTGVTAWFVLQKYIDITQDANTTFVFNYQGLRGEWDFERGDARVLEPSIVDFSKFHYLHLSDIDARTHMPSMHFIDSPDEGFLERLKKKECVAWRNPDITGLASSDDRQGVKWARKPILLSTTQKLAHGMFDSIRTVNKAGLKPPVKDSYMLSLFQKAVRRRNPEVALAVLNTMAVSRPSPSPSPRLSTDVTALSRLLVRCGVILAEDVAAIPEVYPFILWMGGVVQSGWDPPSEVMKALRACVFVASATRFEYSHRMFPGEAKEVSSSKKDTRFDFTPGADYTSRVDSINFSDGSATGRRAKALIQSVSLRASMQAGVSGDHKLLKTTLLGLTRLSKSMWDYFSGDPVRWINNLTSVSERRVYKYFYPTEGERGDSDEDLSGILLCKRLTQMRPDTFIASVDMHVNPEILHGFLAKSVVVQRIFSDSGLVQRKRSSVSPSMYDNLESWVWTTRSGVNKHHALHDSEAHPSTREANSSAYRRVSEVCDKIWNREVSKVFIEVVLDAIQQDYPGLEKYHNEDGALDHAFEFTPEDRSDGVGLGGPSSGEGPSAAVTNPEVSGSRNKLLQIASRAGLSGIPHPEETDKRERELVDVFGHGKRLVGHQQVSSVIEVSGLLEDSSSSPTSLHLVPSVRSYLFEALSLYWGDTDTLSSSKELLRAIQSNLENLHPYISPNTFQFEAIDHPVLRAFCGHMDSEYMSCQDILAAALRAVCGAGSTWVPTPSPVYLLVPAMNTAPVSHWLGRNDNSEAYVLLCPDPKLHKKRVGKMYCIENYAYWVPVLEKLQEAGISLHQESYIQSEEAVSSELERASCGGNRYAQKLIRHGETPVGNIHFMNRLISKLLVVTKVGNLVDTKHVEDEDIPREVADVLRKGALFWKRVLERHFRKHGLPSGDRYSVDQGSSAEREDPEKDPFESDGTPDALIELHQLPRLGCREVYESVACCVDSPCVIDLNLDHTLRVNGVLFTAAFTKHRDQAKRSWNKRAQNKDVIEANRMLHHHTSVPEIEKTLSDMVCKHYFSEPEVKEQIRTTLSKDTGRPVTHRDGVYERIRAILSPYKTSAYKRFEDAIMSRSETLFLLERGLRESAVDRSSLYVHADARFDARAVRRDHYVLSQVGDSPKGVVTFDFSEMGSEKVRELKKLFQEATGREYGNEEDRVILDPRTLLDVVYAHDASISVVQIVITPRCLALSPAGTLGVFVAGRSPPVIVRSVYEPRKQRQEIEDLTKRIRKTLISYDIAIVSPPDKNAFITDAGGDSEGVFYYIPSRGHAISASASETAHTISSSQLELLGWDRDSLGVSPVVRKSPMLVVDVIALNHSVLSERMCVTEQGQSTLSDLFHDPGARASFASCLYRVNGEILAFKTFSDASLGFTGLPSLTTVALSEDETESISRVDSYAGSIDRDVKRVYDEGRLSEKTIPPRFRVRNVHEVEEEVFFEIDVSSYSDEEEKSEDGVGITWKPDEFRAAGGNIQLIEPDILSRSGLMDEYSSVMTNRELSTKRLEMFIVSEMCRPDTLMLVTIGSNPDRLLLYIPPTLRKTFGLQRVMQVKDDISSVRLSTHIRLPLWASDLAKSDEALEQELRSRIVRKIAEPVVTLDVLFNDPSCIYVTKDGMKKGHYTLSLTTPAVERGATQFYRVRCPENVVIVDEQRAAAVLSPAEYAYLCPEGGSLLNSLVDKNSDVLLSLGTPGSVEGVAYLQTPAHGYHKSRDFTIAPVEDGVIVDDETTGSSVSYVYVPRIAQGQKQSGMFSIKKQLTGVVLSRNTKLRTLPRGAVGFKFDRFKSDTLFNEVSSHESVTFADTVFKRMYADPKLGWNTRWARDNGKEEPRPLPPKLSGMGNFVGKEVCIDIVERVVRHQHDSVIACENETDHSGEDTPGSLSTEGFSLDENQSLAWVEGHRHVEHACYKILRSDELYRLTGEHTYTCIGTLDILKNSPHNTAEVVVPADGVLALVVGFSQDVPRRLHAKHIHRMGREIKQKLGSHPRRRNFVIQSEAEVFDVWGRMPCAQGTFPPGNVLPVWIVPPAPRAGTKFGVHMDRASLQSSPLSDSGPGQRVYPFSEPSPELGSRRITPPDVDTERVDTHTVLTKHGLTRPLPSIQNVLSFEVRFFVTGVYDPHPVPHMVFSDENWEEYVSEKKRDSAEEDDDEEAGEKPHERDVSGTADMPSVIGHKPGGDTGDIQGLEGYYLGRISGAEALSRRIVTQPYSIPYGGSSVSFFAFVTEDSHITFVLELKETSKVLSVPTNYLPFLIPISKRSAMALSVKARQLDWGNPAQYAVNRGESDLDYERVASDSSSDPATLNSVNYLKDFLWTKQARELMAELANHGTLSEKRPVPRVSAKNSAPARQQAAARARMSASGAAPSRKRSGNSDDSGGRTTKRQRKPPRAPRKRKKDTPPPRERTPDDDLIDELLDADDEESTEKKPQPEGLTREEENDMLDGLLDGEEDGDDPISARHGLDDEEGPLRKRMRNSRGGQETHPQDGQGRDQVHMPGDILRMLVQLFVAVRSRGFGKFNDTETKELVDMSGRNKEYIVNFAWYHTYDSNEIYRLAAGPSRKATREGDARSGVRWEPKSIFKLSDLRLAMDRPDDESAFYTRVDTSGTEEDGAGDHPKKDNSVLSSEPKETRAPSGDSSSSFKFRPTAQAVSALLTSSLGRPTQEGKDSVSGQDARSGTHAHSSTPEKEEQSAVDERAPADDHSGVGARGNGVSRKRPSTHRAVSHGVSGAVARKYLTPSGGSVVPEGGEGRLLAASSLWTVMLQENMRLGGKQFRRYGDTHVQHDFDTCAPTDGVYSSSRDDTGVYDGGDIEGWKSSPLYPYFELAVNPKLDQSRLQHNAGLREVLESRRKKGRKDQSTPLKEDISKTAVQRVGTSLPRNFVKMFAKLVNSLEPSLETPIVLIREFLSGVGRAERLIRYNATNSSPTVFIPVTTRGVMAHKSGTNTREIELQIMNTWDRNDEFARVAIMGFACITNALVPKSLVKWDVRTVNSTGVLESIANGLALLREEVMKLLPSKNLYPLCRDPIPGELCERMPREIFGAGDPQNGTRLYEQQEVMVRWGVQHEKRGMGGMLAANPGLGKTASIACVIGSYQLTPVESLPKETKASVKTSPYGYMQRTDPDAQLIATTTLVVAPQAVVRWWKEDLTREKFWGDAETSPFHVETFDNAAEVVGHSKTYFSNVYSRFHTRVEQLKKAGKLGDKEALIRERVDIIRANLQDHPVFLKAIPEKHAVYCMSYETLSELYGRGHTLRANRIILDESHKIRYMYTKRFAACHHTEAKLRWCMTGTPQQNSITDVFAQAVFMRISPYSILGWRHMHSNLMNDGFKLQLFQGVMVRPEPSNWSKTTYLPTLECDVTPDEREAIDRALATIRDPNDLYEAGVAMRTAMGSMRNTTPLRRSGITEGKFIRIKQILDYIVFQEHEAALEANSSFANSQFKNVSIYKVYSVFRDGALDQFARENPEEVVELVRAGYMVPSEIRRAAALADYPVIGNELYSKGGLAPSEKAVVENEFLLREASARYHKQTQVVNKSSKRVYNKKVSESDLKTQPSIVLDWRLTEAFGKEFVDTHVNSSVPDAVRRVFSGIVLNKEEAAFIPVNTKDQATQLVNRLRTAFPSHSAGILLLDSDESIARFRNGANGDQRVIAGVGTFEYTGTGLDLTYARWIILPVQVWNPGVAVQAIARVDRIRQRHKPYALFMVDAGRGDEEPSFEMMMHRVMKRKMDDMNRNMTSVQREAQGIDQIEDILRSHMQAAKRRVGASASSGSDPAVSSRECSSQVVVSGREPRWHEEGSDAPAKHEVHTRLFDAAHALPTKEDRKERTRLKVKEAIDQRSHWEKPSGASHTPEELARTPALSDVREDDIPHMSSRELRAILDRYASEEGSPVHRDMEDERVDALKLAKNTYSSLLKWVETTPHLMSRLEKWRESGVAQLEESYCQDPLREWCRITQPSKGSLTLARVAAHRFHPFEMVTVPKGSVLYFLSSPCQGSRHSPVYSSPDALFYASAYNAAARVQKEQDTLASFVTEQPFRVAYIHLQGSVNSLSILAYLAQDLQLVDYKDRKDSSKILSEVTRYIRSKDPSVQGLCFTTTQSHRLYPEEPFTKRTIKENAPPVRYINKDLYVRTGQPCVSDEDLETEEDRRKNRIRRISAPVRGYADSAVTDPYLESSFGTIQPLDSDVLVAPAFYLPGISPSIKAGSTAFKAQVTREDIREAMAKVRDSKVEHFIGNSKKEIFSIMLESDLVATVVRKKISALHSSRSGDAGDTPTMTHPLIPTKDAAMCQTYWAGTEFPPSAPISVRQPPATYVLFARMEQEMHSIAGSTRQAERYIYELCPYVVFWWPNYLTCAMVSYLHKKQVPVSTPFVLCTAVTELLSFGINSSDLPEAFDQEIDPSWGMLLERGDGISLHAHRSEPYSSAHLNELVPETHRRVVWTLRNLEDTSRIHPAIKLFLSHASPGCVMRPSPLTE